MDSRIMVLKVYREESEYCLLEGILEIEGSFWLWSVVQGY